VNFVDSPEVRPSPEHSFPLATLLLVLGETQLPPATETSQWPFSPEGAYLGMRAYEVMVILDPDLEEKTVKPSLDTFLNVVKKDGGTVDGVDVWGRRRMAYDIAKKSEGIYAVMDLTCSAAAVAELDRQLNLNEAVLRTKVIRREDKEK
jgi:small subunit ribosomal protein S6